MTDVLLDKGDKQGNVITIYFCNRRMIMFDSLGYHRLKGSTEVQEGITSTQQSTS